MVRKRIFFICVICFLISAISVSAEESLTITTYYPSPYGSYNSLQTDKFGVGDNNNDGTLTSADVPTTSGDVWIKGKVGIGTTSPGFPLDVAGVINTYSVASASGYILSSLSGLYKNLNVIGNDIYLLTATTAGGGSSGTRVTIKNTTGNVGIGQTNPSARLHVQRDNTTNPNLVKSTNICVRVNYSSATGIRPCPDGYYNAWGTGNPSAAQNGYVICCQACVDGDPVGPPSGTPDGICDY